MDNLWLADESLLIANESNERNMAKFIASPEFFQTTSIVSSDSSLECHQVSMEGFQYSTVLLVQNKLIDEILEPLKWYVRKK